MNTAAKGRRFEHELRHLLEANGYSVTRGAGSKGEFFGMKVDLIATKETRDTNYRIECYGFQLKAKAK